MNPQTGEIKIFETEISDGWIGLDHLQEGRELTLDGLTFKITKSVIHIGKPGRVELSLEGKSVGMFEKMVTDKSVKADTPTVRDAMKAYKERIKKKEWE